MKPFLTAILSFFILINAMAQDPGYTGPAAKKVKYFWDYAGKPLESMSESVLNHSIGEMEYALKGTKEKDAAYNTTAMEAALDKFKNKRKEIKIADANSYRGDKTQTAPAKPVSNDPGKLFEEFFENVNLQIGSTSDLPKAPGR